MSLPTRARIPAHLRQYVVDQDYSAYDEIDQAVWRFVMLQTYDRLRETAHPAYVKGLEETGISVERIPRVEEMDRCLAEYGWGAVSVDGFIPPRAFQEFQALRIMTIAAGIRRRRHLAYTPAPDIIHESAGHAPIVPDEKYRNFLQLFGEIGKKCFSLPEDRVVYEAIRHLSEVKEDRGSTPELIEAAQKRLDEANAAVGKNSEAALLARLHWWTVEYGLVGTPEDYKIYGAGLLSSLGESTSLHSDRVAKIPFTIDCVDVSYDITRPQPQLFVCRDFDHLFQVLDEFSNTLAQRRGGEQALRTMLGSKELGTVEFDTGMQITGRLTEIVDGNDGPAWIRFDGPVSLALEGRILPGQGPAAHAEGFSTALGPLADGTRLGDRDEGWLLDIAGADRRVEWTWTGGVRFDGRIEKTQTDAAGRLRVIRFQEARATLDGRLLYDPRWGSFDLAVGGEVKSCFAGAADSAHYPPTEFSKRRAPRPKDLATAREEAKVLDLYREALQLWENPESPHLLGEFEKLADRLSAHPQEWLLRWNLLECLRKAGRGGDLQLSLRDELLEIEKSDHEGLPISTGLAYLKMV